MECASPARTTAISATWGERALVTIKAVSWVMANSMPLAVCAASMGVLPATALILTLASAACWAHTLSQKIMFHLA